jgi:RNA polymerase sigma-70 factor (ECF subfamily)
MTGHTTTRHAVDLHLVLGVLAPRDPAVALPTGVPSWMLLSEATVSGGAVVRRWVRRPDRATSSEVGYRERLIALVELARGGDSEASDSSTTTPGSVYRFVFYTRNQTLAEDLTSETSEPAQHERFPLAGQGLPRLADDHRPQPLHRPANRPPRLELATEDMGVQQRTEAENAVLAGRNEVLLNGLRQLSDVRDCLIMRFLQGLSIAETAGVLGRSEGAIKQLQLRGVRNLAKLMPTGWRDGDRRLPTANPRCPRIVDGCPHRRDLPHDQRGPRDHGAPRRHRRLVEGASTGGARLRDIRPLGVVGAMRTMPTGPGSTFVTALHEATIAEAEGARGAPPSATTPTSVSWPPRRRLVVAAGNSP